MRTVLVNHTRPANDPPADFLAGWSEVVAARPDPADRSSGDALLRVLPGVLDRLAGGPFLLWIELDRLLPPWHVPQAVFDVYVEDLIDDEDDEDDPDAEEPDTDEAEAPDDEPDADGVDGVDDADEEDDEPEPEEDAEPVPPWADPPTGWFDKDDLPSWELLHRSFGAAVTAFDADLGEVFDLFRERGLDRCAAWVLTADRGFPLGEHGLIGPHRPWLHEELVHLPLVVRLPGGEQGGRRVPAITQPPDLAPTLAALLTGGDGGLVPLMHGKPGGRDAAVSGLDLGGASEWAIRTDEWALVLPVTPHPDDDPRPALLFRKPDDYWEVNDVRPRNVELADELEARLRAAVSPPR